MHMVQLIVLRNILQASFLLASPLKKLKLQPNGKQFFFFFFLISMSPDMFSFSGRPKLTDTFPY